MVGMPLYVHGMNTDWIQTWTESFHVREFVTTRPLLWAQQISERAVGSRRSYLREIVSPGLVTKPTQSRRVQSL